MMTDPHKLREMGIRARHYMESRSFERCFEELWRIYEGKTDHAERPPLESPGELAIAV